MIHSDNTTPHPSSHYDCDVRQTIPYYETMHHEAIDLVLTVRPDVRVWLDTGCGTGYLPYLALKCFPHTRFVLADPAPAMLAEAARRLDGIDEGRVQLLPAVASEALFQYVGAVQPQVITAVMCHHYLQKKERGRALRACFDLLEPKGLFVAFENVAAATDEGVQWGLERWARYQTGQGRTAQAVADHVRRYNSAYFPITVGEHVDLLRQTGFRTVELFWFSHMQAGLYAVK
jgi:tRNA (cmo5U34)-methyltransferase